MTGAEDYWQIFVVIAGVFIVLASLIGYFDQRDQCKNWRKRARRAEGELHAASMQLNKALNAAPTSARADAGPGVTPFSSEPGSANSQRLGGDG